MTQTALLRPEATHESAAGQTAIPQPVAPSGLPPFAWLMDAAVAKGSPTNSEVKGAPARGTHCQQAPQAVVKPTKDNSLIALVVANAAEKSTTAEISGEMGSKPTASPEQSSQRQDLESNSTLIAGNLAAMVMPLLLLQPPPNPQAKPTIANDGPTASTVQPALSSQPTNSEPKSLHVGSGLGAAVITPFRSAQATNLETKPMLGGGGLATSTIPPVLSAQTSKAERKRPLMKSGMAAMARPPASSAQPTYSETKLTLGDGGLVAIPMPPVLTLQPTKAEARSTHTDGDLVAAAMPTVLPALPTNPKTKPTLGGGEVGTIAMPPVLSAQPSNPEPKPTFAGSGVVVAAVPPFSAAQSTNAETKPTLGGGRWEAKAKIPVMSPQPPNPEAKPTLTNGGGAGMVNPPILADPWANPEPELIQARGGLEAVAMPSVLTTQPTNAESNETSAEDGLTARIMPPNQLPDDKVATGQPTRGEAPVLASAAVGPTFFSSLTRWAGVTIEENNAASPGQLSPAVSFSGQSAGQHNNVAHSSGGNPTQSEKAPQPKQVPEANLGEALPSKIDERTRQFEPADSHLTAPTSMTQAPPIDPAALAEQAGEQATPYLRLPLAERATPGQANPSSPPEPAVVGTSAASQGEQMKKLNKPANISALAENNLPATGVAAGPEFKLPFINKKWVFENDADRAREKTVVESLGSSMRDSLIRMDKVETPPEPVRTGEFLSKTQALVTELAVRLKQIDGQSLSAVVRIDEHLEMAFRLKMQDGQVEVCAQCQRGDGSILQAHWPELQKQLATQGIRLTTSGGESPAPQTNHQDQGARGQPQPWVDNEAPRPAAKPGLNKPRLANLNANRRGWECWA